MRQFEELTELKPVYGGKHPSSFTHNALVSLGGDAYLEIIAPRPDAENVPEEFKHFIKLMAWTWAVGTDDLESTKKKLQSAGFECLPSQPGSRAKPDGTLLSWATMAINNQPNFPFFIEWGRAVVHPSKTSTTGCFLKKISIQHPQPEALQKFVRVLGTQVMVVRGDVHKISVTINTPNGEVNF